MKKMFVSLLALTVTSSMAFAVRPDSSEHALVPKPSGQSAGHAVASEGAGPDVGSHKPFQRSKLTSLRSGHGMIRYIFSREGEHGRTVLQTMNGVLEALHKYALPHADIIEVKFKIGNRSRGYDGKWATGAGMKDFYVTANVRKHFLHITLPPEHGTKEENFQGDFYIEWPLKKNYGDGLEEDNPGIEKAREQMGKLNDELGQVFPDIWKKIKMDGSPEGIVRNGPLVNIMHCEVSFVDLKRSMPPVKLPFMRDDVFSTDPALDVKRDDGNRSMTIEIPRKKAGA